MTDDAKVPLWRHASAIALLPAMNTIVVPGFLLALQPPPAAASAAARFASWAVGGALVAAGAVLVIHTIRLFMQRGRGTLAPWDPTRALVDAGAYRYVRNPMKAGLFAVLAGEALALRSPGLAIWFACFALVNVVYIRMHEEPRLAARFGAQYLDYCARVPRWWPRRPLPLKVVMEQSK
jgi:protein-S-isoprenylcysteine O-methyltransferase Ste14